MHWTKVEELKPPFEIPILVKFKSKWRDSDGVCGLKIENDKPYYTLNPCGVSGYEYETDFDYKDITHWVVID